MNGTTTPSLGDPMADSFVYNLLNSGESPDQVTADAQAAWLPSIPWWIYAAGGIVVFLILKR